MIIDHRFGKPQVKLRPHGEKPPRGSLYTKPGQVPFYDAARAQTAKQVRGSGGSRIGGSGGGGGGNRRGGARALSPTGRVKLMRATQSRGGSAVSRSTSALPRS